MATIDDVPLFHNMPRQERLNIVLGIRESRKIRKVTYDLTGEATPIKRKTTVGKKEKASTKKMTKDQAAALLRILGGIS